MRPSTPIPAARSASARGSARASSSITVEDSGIGIATEDLPQGVRHVRAGALGAGSCGRRTGHRTGAREGNRRAARRPHRGGERRRGQGQPLHRAPAERVRGRRPARRRCAPLRQRPCRCHKRILLADDNRDAAESLAIILRLEGHEVELAHDGHAALRASRRSAPTWRCSTSACPRPMATRSRGRSAPRPTASDVLLIAITGWAQDSDKAQSRAAGFDHHLTKPIEPDTLIELLARADTVIVRRCQARLASRGLRRCATDGVRAGFYPCGRDRIRGGDT